MNPMNKTLKDHYIEILTTAGEHKLPSQVSNDGEYSAMFPYYKELHASGYLEGEMVCGGGSDGSIVEVLIHPAITINGREFLERLKAERPMAKFKSKGGELLWLALTNAITALVAAFVTWMLVKKP